MHIFLIGPPGVGKSTVAPHLAALFGAAVVDVDRQIERRAGKSCRAVIEEDGMERFRDIEGAVVAHLQPTPAWVVVDTGGGVVIRDANRVRMRELGIVVGLQASLPHLTSGIAATMAKRPHQHLDPRERARAALRERKALYAQAEATFRVDGRSPRDVARVVAAWLVASRGVRIDVGGEHPYPVLARAGLLEHAGAHLRDLGWRGRVALVCERRIGSTLGETVLRSLRTAGLAAVVIEVPAGERAKRLSSLARLWDALADAGVGRDGGVVTVGGGATSDLAAFAAATYLRGVRVAHVPTTLLAMVDAAIGGKTAIDIAAGKNLVGAFHAPDAVLADITALGTLPPRQISSGLAEVVKSAFLADRTAVTQVRRALPAARGRDLAATLALVALGAGVKAAIVSLDAHESGLRELLNFGHTMGHAYEAASGYRATHGEAVAVGMVFATALAERLGLAAPSLRPLLEELLVGAGLPTRARIPRAAWTFLGRDKKARAGAVRWILPRRIGSFTQVTEVDPRALRAAAAAVEGRAA